MDAGHEGKCHTGADEHIGLQRETTINIQVALLGGQTLSFETHLSATVSDIKALIHEKLFFHPRGQTLTLDKTILADSSALLKDVAVNDGSLLSLVFCDEPLGQRLLTELDGKIKDLSHQGMPSEVLNEFQLMSLQAAHDMFNYDPEKYGPWGYLGAWSIDLYWTTRSNKRRYEYWSTAPGDNERGALIRIDVGSVTCIGEGSDDGLCVFRKFQDDRVAMRLIREGWPRFQAESYDHDGILRSGREEEVEDSNDDFGFSEAETAAMKAIKSMKKLTPAAKKKAIKKLPLNVQMKVAKAMKASTSAKAGDGEFDAAASGGLFGAPLATTGDSLFGAVPATTAGGLFGGGSLPNAALVETGSGLFGDAMTGGGLFGAPATTGGRLCTASPATTGNGLGLFGAAPATSTGGIFGGGGLFSATPVAADGLLSAASATAGGGRFGAPATTGVPLGEALATTGSSYFGVAPVATGASSSRSCPDETSSKQDECKTQ